MNTKPVSLKEKYGYPSTAIRNLVQEGKVTLPDSCPSPSEPITKFKKDRFVYHCQMALEYLRGDMKMQGLAVREDVRHQRIGQIVNAGIVMLIECGALTLPKIREDGVA
jgi:hypothetical protein